MKKLIRKLVKFSAVSISAAVLALMLGLGMPPGASAGEEDARNLVKAMSDYMAAQKAISFAYDANLEVVTKEQPETRFVEFGYGDAQSARQNPRHASRRFCRYRDSF